MDQIEEAQMRRMTRRLSAGCLVAVAALLMSCEDRPRRDTSYLPEPKDSRELGHDVGAAARDAKEGTERFFEGVGEGFGGSGSAEPDVPPPAAD